MPKGHVEFDYDKCKSCLLCVEFCPKEILYQDKDELNKAGYNVIKVTDMDRCIGCGLCAVMCPDSVIKVEVETK